VRAQSVRELLWFFFPIFNLYRKNVFFVILVIIRYFISSSYASFELPNPSGIEEDTWVKGPNLLSSTLLNRFCPEDDECLD